MTSEEIYNDINNTLTELTKKVGVNNFIFEITTSVSLLPNRKPMMYLWYLNSSNDVKLIYEKLTNKFKISYNKDSIGQYLYVYGVMNQS